MGDACFDQTEASAWEEPWWPNELCTQLLPSPCHVRRQEHDDPWQQWALPPEGLGRTQWLCFEKVIWVNDVFVGGTRAFRDTQDAQLFRRRAALHAGP